MIVTVLGEIREENIGFCQCHEHIMLSKGKSYYVNEALCIDDYQKSLAELLLYRKAGGKTLVDAQPVGCNRMASELVGLSKESDVNIIASTGFHKMVFYPENHWVFSLSQEELAAIFVHELTEGMYFNCDRSLPKAFIGSKAGIIKTAFDSCGLTKQYEKLFLAAVKASNETGSPIMVHIEFNTNPLELVGFLKDAGANLNKTIFCHMDRACPDIEVHKKVCDEGIYLEYDTIGRFKYHSDSTEAGIFAEMINSGYADRLLFSLDTTRFRMKSYTPDAVGLDYIIKTFIPLLVNNGISTDRIRKISTDNCKMALSKFK